MASPQWQGATSIDDSSVRSMIKKLKEEEEQEEEGELKLMLKCIQTSSSNNLHLTMRQLNAVSWHIHRCHVMISTIRESYGLYSFVTTVLGSCFLWLETVRLRPRT
eukprot:gnl/MRDRNA2_/MRDRNA2_93457_c0_seq1.p1 gnl/MRDRNA2_/MRDRNA2_93457_c0~~gnl/MRDRNA2_/MRDRNA2_93457_c0_seq1.p1  ORF type:complete len:106 (-),score=7.31 gnl/MRDRNA2_/MRDRNA2_93457_c0_seq1:199-516(-)